LSDGLADSATNLQVPYTVYCALLPMNSYRKRKDEIALQSKIATDGARDSRDHEDVIIGSS